MIKFLIISVILQIALYSQTDTLNNFRSVKSAEPGRSSILNLPLTWSRYELNEISDIVKGKYLFWNKATEEGFKQNAEKYKVIHIASHTIIDDDNPDLSRLAFYHDKNSDDGFLNVYEVYEMKLNAEMVVLSSCNTGFGKVITGEGVLSIARAFMYAGCPSVIMSLWDIDDRSTAEIVISFYKSLAKGHTKNAALREAKLNFLSDSDQYTANPLFWGGLVSIGKQNNLIIAQSDIWIGEMTLLFLIIIVTFSFMIFFIIKRSHLRSFRFS